MRVVVVAPGHAFSTLDVYNGLCAGLAACGATVFAYPLHDTLETMELLVGAAKLMNIAPPKGYPDPLLMATAGVPGYAMAKRADWVIVVHGLNVPPSIPATLKRGGYRTALLCTESPYQLDEERMVAEHYDVVFTNDRGAPPRFSFNPPGTVHHLAHAYHPAVHTPEGPSADPCDVFFCGTRYPERAALLDGVNWDGIAVCDRSVDYSGGVDPVELFKKMLPNVETATYYRAARISLNQHRSLKQPTGDAHISAGEALSLNPRAYEIPACGGFMVSDARADLEQVFGAGVVPTYHDSESLERVIRYYLAHEDERRALADRQRAAVLPHSWAARARQVLDTLTAISATPRIAA